MNKLLLSAKWWNQNRPSSLPSQQSEICKIISNFEKVKPTLELTARKRDRIEIGKSLKTLAQTEKALQRDLRAVKKADDKKVVSNLVGIQKELAAARSRLRKSFTIDGGPKGKPPATKGSGRSGVPSAAMADADEKGGVAGTVEKIVNSADKAWGIIKGDKPTTGSKYCNALPKGYAATQMSGWKKSVIDWPFVIPTWPLGLELVNIQFKIVFLHHGTCLETGGFWVNGFSVFAKTIDTDMTVTVDATASVSGSPYNAGSASHPIGAVPLQVSVTLDGWFNSKNYGYELTAYGDGSLSSV